MFLSPFCFSNLTSDKVGSLTIEFIPQHVDIVSVSPKSIEILELNFTSFNYTFVAHALSPGKSEITAVASEEYNKYVYE